MERSVQGPSAVLIIMPLLSLAPSSMAASSSCIGMAVCETCPHVAHSYCIWRLQDRF